MGLKKFDSPRECYKKFNIFNFKQLHFIRSICFIYKNKTLFDFTVKTRPPINMFCKLPRWYKTHSRFQAGYQLPSLYNKISFNYKKIAKFSVFKKSIKEAAKKMS